MAHLKAIDLSRRIREEVAKTGRPIRCSEDVKQTAFMRRFSEQALALDADGQRIPGKTPQVGLTDFSLRELAASTIVRCETGEPVGDSFIQEYFRDPHSLIRLRESGAMAAVDYSQFSGIMGQLLINSVLQRFTAEEFVFTGRAGTYTTRMVSGERIPGVSPPADPDGDGVSDTLLKRPQQPYKYFGFGEEYVELPETEERGGIIGVDRLAIYADRTGLIAQQAAKVGYILGLNKEKRGLRCLIGLDGSTFKEKRLKDSAPVEIDPYQLAAAGSGAHQLAFAYPSRQYPFYNDIPSNPLTDYTAIKTAEIAFSKTHDPSTGEPVVVGKPAIFACKTREMDIAPILQAVNIWKLTQAGAVAPYVSNAINTVSPNPLNVLGNVNVTLSRQLRDQLVAAGCTGANGNPDPDKIWFYGDVAEAIAYAENWPIKVIQAPANSEAEFSQDIVMRFRADERGKWIWLNPRVLQRHNYQTQT